MIIDRNTSTKVAYDLIWEAGREALDGADPCNIATKVTDMIEEKIGGLDDRSVADTLYESIEARDGIFLLCWIWSCSFDHVRDFVDDEWIEEVLIAALDSGLGLQEFHVWIGSGYTGHLPEEVKSRVIDDPETHKELSGRRLLGPERQVF